MRLLGKAALFGILTEVGQVCSVGLLDAVNSSSIFFVSSMSVSSIVHVPFLTRISRRVERVTIVFNKLSSCILLITGSFSPYNQLQRHYL